MTVIASINLKEIMVHHDDTETVTCTYGDSESLSLLTYEWSGATIVTNVVLTYTGDNYATATVTNGKGDGIENKTVTLYTDINNPQYSPNGVLGTATTNNNGVAQIYNSYSGGWIYGTIYCVCDDATSNSIDTNNPIPAQGVDDLE